MGFEKFSQILLIKEVGQIPAMDDLSFSVRIHTEHKIEQSCAKSIDVGLVGVLAGSFLQLGGSIIPCSSANDFITALVSCVEVADLEIVILTKKNVARLEIQMGNFFVVKVVKSLHKLMEVGSDKLVIVLEDASLDDIVEVAEGAKFHNNIRKVHFVLRLSLNISVVVFVVADYVGVVDVSESNFSSITGWGAIFSVLEHLHDANFATIASFCKIDFSVFSLKILIRDVIGP
mmetsp:Transcript_808/g.740  ORF Transcript_808/g.740 Transcript_808/m.740 type:complete len:232 (-) Transcript_808:166-861(-)